MRLCNITIGADPELFIVKGRNKTVVSSIGLIPGKKGAPYRAEDMPEGFGLETDNILAEFNIPPCTTREEFINNILYMQNYIKEFVKRINPNYDIQCIASKVVPSSQLQSKEAKEFGCDVDFNAYTEMPNPKPEGAKTNLRSAGFHIHIGYENPNIDTSLCLIKYLDAFLGLPSVILDSDTKRRSLYGKAGCFRLTEYGCEYRVLSSAMMKDIDTLSKVWAQLTRATIAYNEGVNIPEYETTIAAINTSDSSIANSLIKKYHICAD